MASSDRATTERLDRVTVRVPREHVAALDTLVDEGAFPNRSAAIRAGVREVLDE